MTNDETLDLFRTKLSSSTEVADFILFLDMLVVSLYKKRSLTSSARTPLMLQLVDHLAKLASVDAKIDFLNVLRHALTNMPTAVFYVGQKPSATFISSAHAYLLDKMHSYVLVDVVVGNAPEESKVAYQGNYLDVSLTVGVRNFIEKHHVVSNILRK